MKNDLNNSSKLETNSNTSTHNQKIKLSDGDLVAIHKLVNEEIKHVQKKK